MKRPTQNWFRGVTERRLEPNAPEPPVPFPASPSGRTWGPAISEDDMMDTKWLALALSGALGMAVACSDDEAVTDGTGGSSGTAGSGGASGNGGASGSGGAAGSTGGSAGSAGSAGADGGPGPGLLLVSGTDFFSQSEIAVVDLASSTVTANLPFSSGDVIPVASGGRGFVLERTAGVVHVLGGTGAIAHSVPVEDSDAGSVPANPSGVAAVSATRAYVALYDRNGVAVIDPTAGTLVETLDLSSFSVSGDGDGFVEVATPIHDAAENRVYVTLARIDRTTIAPPDFQLACPTEPALLVALDGTSGAVVDLNGAAAGEAIPLGLHNPIDAALDVAGGRLFVLAAGCFAPGDGGSARTGHGAVAIDLASGQATVALAPSDGSFLSRLVYIGSDAALVNRFDETFAEHWNRWTTSQTSLGAELSGVPSAPSHDGAGSLYGTVFSSEDGGSAASVVRYDIAAETSSTIVSDPFDGSFASSGGSAIVK